MAGSCECGNEPSGSIKCWKFLDWLRTCQLLGKDSAPWKKQLRMYLSYPKIVPLTGAALRDKCNVTQGCTNPTHQSPGRLYFVLWRLVSLLAPNFFYGFQIFGKLLHPMTYCAGSKVRSANKLALQINVEPNKKCSPKPTYLCHRHFAKMGKR